MAPQEPNLPDDPNDLVALILDPSQPPEVVNRAWEKLRRYIRRIAERMAYRACLLEQYIEGFVDESCGEIYQLLKRGKYDPARRAFRSWLKTVLHRRAVDLIRKLSRAPVNLGEDIGSPEIEDADDQNDDEGPIWDPPDRNAPEPADNVEARQSLQIFGGRIRAVLDRVSWPVARKVDYYAAFLLLLRLRALDRLANKAHAKSPHDDAEALIPWHDAESLRRVAPNHPTIGEIWSLIRQKDLYAVDLECLQRLYQENFSLTISYNSLAMWFHRAKHEARKAIREEDWCNCGFEILTSFRGRDER